MIDDGNLQGLSRRSARPETLNNRFVSVSLAASLISRSVIISISMSLCVRSPFIVADPYRYIPSI